MTKLREPPYSLCYHSIWETLWRISAKVEPDGKNAKDWAIRRRESKPVMIGHDSVSETAKVSVLNEGLISPRVLKVQSKLHRDMKKSL